MKNKVTYCFWILFSCVFYAQTKLVNEDNSKTNPVVFYEFYGGYGANDKGGLKNLGVNLNYEFSKSNLLTTRFTYLGRHRTEYVFLFPDIKVQEEQNEYAVLYGKRWVKDGHSFSASGGISYVNRRDYTYIETNYYRDDQNYAGFPFELNIKWFKKEKSPFRAYYGIIPTGKREVSFGRAAGFKLIGNISKHSYFGVSFTLGLGWHKKY